MYNTEIEINIGILEGAAELTLESMGDDYDRCLRCGLSGTNKQVWRWSTAMSDEGEAVCRNCNASLWKYSLEQLLKRVKRINPALTDESVEVSR